MSEWTVEVTTHPGSAPDEDSVAAILDRLMADPRALNPVISWDLDTHAVSVTFGTEADEYVCAMVRASSALRVRRAKLTSRLRGDAKERPQR